MKMLGIKFNGEAFKAWVAGILTGLGGAATTEDGLGYVVVRGIEAITSFDIPTSMEAWIAGGVAWAIGYLAVYFAPNAQPATA